MAKDYCKCDLDKITGWDNFNCNVCGKYVPKLVRLALALREHEDETATPKDDDCISVAEKQIIDCCKILI